MKLRKYKKDVIGSKQKFSKGPEQNVPIDIWVSMVSLVVCRTGRPKLS